MSTDERKGGGGGKGEEEDDVSSVPDITVTNIVIEPNMCPVSDPLKLEIEFKSDREIPGAVWDVAVRRVLGADAASDCNRGQHLTR